jgi:transposase
MGRHGLEAARACPDCGTVSDRVNETVVTRPRDVRRAGDAVDLRWVKVRRKCGNQQCPRKTFTESVPALPPRCRITARLRGQAGAEVAERGITPAEAARHAGSPGRWCTMRSPPRRTRCWTRTRLR